MKSHRPAVIDVAGTELDREDRRRLKHPLTGGVVLFARNWRHRAQMVALTSEIRAIRPDALICVDHEGGRVQRFRTDGFTHLPPMRRFGELWMDDDPNHPGSGALAAMGAATAAGYVLGSELRACGIDLSFAPVLDLDHGHSGVIGDRAFHRDPRIVALLSKSLMHGMLIAGMQHCAKHFPGHGFVRADSHLALPVDERPLEAILGDDARPYEWLSTSLAAVMPAHVTYPRVDAAPAGFSARWLKEILRGRLAFTGAIVSDDLAMEGARSAGGYVESALAALQAGCDMVLLCNRSPVDGGADIDALLDGLTQAATQGRWQPDLDSEARRMALLPLSSPMTWDELMRHLPYQRARARLPMDR